MFDTEFSFVLPKGYVDRDGNLHKEGKMRLATAADEIIPLRDPRVQQNPGYLVVILLSRVITSLGTMQAGDTKVIEGLYTADLAYL
ncbi:MAG: phage tail assembly protein, partial [Lachnospiraceae bacterium]|nr:phage tail assembly protein [Lachnospiraceae bacterium]